MIEVPAAKRELRTHYQQIRKMVSAKSGSRFSKKIAGNFPAIGGGKNVAVYIPMAGEVDTKPLMEKLAAARARIFLPVVVSKNAPLSFYLYIPGDALVRGNCGNDEPQKKGRQEVPAIIIVPLVAFDENGARLGQGGGYYDRTLGILRKNRSILAIGLAYEAQKNDSLPFGPGDQPLDAVVTEKRVYDFRPR